MGIGIPVATVAVEAMQAPQLRQGFDLVVRHAPLRFKAAGRDRLAYELYLTNHASSPLELVRIDILDGDGDAVLADLAGEALMRASDVVGEAEAAGAPIRVASGRVAIVYVDIPLPADRTRARSLRHRLTYRGNGEAVVTGGETPVASADPPVLGPPLRGGPWTAVYDPGMARGHRRVVYAVGGRARIPGRFAIDWMSPDTQGPRGFGSEVLAVADSTVVGVRDGVEEPDPGEPRPPVSLSEASGNYVALDIGAGFVAFYEHLAPGLRVAVGDRVRKGQVVGRLGSTGQASRPHLHFHVANANSLLDAEGVPYILTGATIVGRYPDIGSADEGGSWQALPHEPLGPGGNHLPPPNTVVRFD
ncbi:M23 family metallopeptidase [Sphingosinicella sp. CPCC 101087]|uniref:M23 family metallopeptidase n=1 Tax=Sphingosinicella sp. CPCC 101087 TaxID=2497754 RepID=UPI00101E055C|nr:M23 family metallopeptidase [Sphingosinicella sp. CPCC 101087]